MSEHEPPIRCTRCRKPGDFADAVYAKGGEWVCRPCRRNTELLREVEQRIEAKRVTIRKAEEEIAKFEPVAETLREEERKLADLEIPTIPTTEDTEDEEGEDE